MVLPSLDTLSTELLLKIFKYLDICELCKLKQTCRRFNDILETWGHSFIKNVKLLVTNQIHPVIINRSARLLSPFERLRISRNWKLGVYSEKSLLYSKAKYIPWLQLEKDLLWLSRDGYVKAYRRNSKGINTKQGKLELKFADLCKKIITYSVGKRKYRLQSLTQYTINISSDGSLWLWSVRNQKFVFDRENCHGADINSVDMSDDIMVSGSRDNYVKIWRKPVDDDPDFKIDNEKIDLFDRVWSVALSEDAKSLLAIGTAGISSRSTVTIHDMINQKFVVKLGSERFGAGVLDIKWDTPSTLWSCGYDAHLRRWDLRSGKCEQAFEDPCESVMYCFQHDHFNSIISGTQSNGRVVLWDTRQKNYVQMYFMDSCRRREKSSPVYSLSYDAEFLFTVTDRHK
ncbi:F-box/WD repeat-containing protein 4 [Asbolus verrucosus]|uniref:F-box/WD repeat-containing protein 4 n=1 Tax=Asbolus verrucosus TaxID=1661398 RepID=A0A482VQP0_ASBVE|nr:F-box/WD repeat-containing protein 4 [Asbolus verrucosus]